MPSSLLARSCLKSSISCWILKAVVPGKFFHQACGIGQAERSGSTFAHESWGSCAFSSLWAYFRTLVHIFCSEYSFLPLVKASSRTAYSMALLSTPPLPVSVDSSESRQAAKAQILRAPQSCVSTSAMVPEWQQSVITRTRTSSSRASSRASAKSSSTRKNFHSNSRFGPGSWKTSSRWSSSLPRAIGVPCARRTLDSTLSAWPE
mmetsp:Transcript_126970/g.353625  ORF Transcript_126970/g.353625 Transcript_126970/m.353625 type:complete len:205 (-) Transcript_126970:291-905(-)